MSNVSPIHFWVTFSVGAAIYQGIKFAIGLTPAWSDFLTSIYWVGICMLLVQIRFVKS